MYALRSVGVHVVQVAFLRLLVRGGFVVVMLVLGRGVVGGGSGEDTGGHVADSAVDAAMLARSGASSSSFDSFYY